MITITESTSFPILPESMTDRTKNLREILWKHACENRKDDWIDKKNLPDLSKPLPGKMKLEPIIIRRARGIAAMLEALTDTEQSLKTNSYKIFPGELLVGIPPMGSNGLGKIFPDYLDHEERHMASIPNRSELSVVGHNVADYQKLVKQGIGSIINFCRTKIQYLETQIQDRGQTLIEESSFDSLQDGVDFYKAVIISCKAVVDYAKRFAELAAKMAEKETDIQRKKELMEIARICHKVPLNPADTLQEALQSILFVHIGLRAGMDQMSFGRLDQTLQPYLENTVQPGVKDLAKAVELVECFIIKTASPLNLTTDHLSDQDHMDYGISMGTQAWYADQRGNINQFLQNVVVGGKDLQENDTTVECTHILIQAWANVNLPTPGLYVRMHKKSPKELMDRVVASITRTGTVPCILNDDVIIPGLVNSMLQDIEDKQDKNGEKTEIKSMAYDYCVDGCWEPILNGQCDWTFNMINGLLILECALNEGATLDSNPMLLRGGKSSYRTQPIHTYDDLQDAFKKNMDFFVFKSAVAMYNYYLLDEFVIPSPLFSAFLGTCLERGRDKSWGGTKYIFGGTILSGLPNMVNSIAAIMKWVFDKEKYEIQDVLGAFKYNFTAPDTAPEKQAIYANIHSDFLCHSPKFGSNDPLTNEVAKFITDCFEQSLDEAKKLADKVYRTIPESPEEAERIRRLRFTAGYYGPALQDHLKNRDITVAFTAGLGTFATYVLMGLGRAASADRHTNAPLAMNNTPPPGTVDGGLGHILATLNSLGLDRFPAGAPVDLCIEAENDTEEGWARVSAVISAVISSFLENNGNILSITLGSTEQYKEIYELAVRASMNDQTAAEALLKWGHVSVRAGGWQTPFITMSLQQQEHYTRSPIMPKSELDTWKD